MRLDPYSVNKTMPHLLAKYASNGNWQPWDYLKYLSHEITKAVIEGNGRIIVNMPPQHGKSMFISKWVPIWYLSNFPHKRIILSTYEASFAAHWGRSVRDELLDNERLHVQLKQDAKAANFWMTKEGGAMMTAGVGGPVTGKSGDLLIIDDPVKNWDEAKSPVYQQRNIDWFNSTLYTRKQPNTTIIILMTRWHERDLAGYLLEEHSDNWKHIRFPAIAEGNDELNRSEGDPLSPERFDKEDLENTKKAVGSQVWSGLYQQRPTALEGGIVKRDWLMFYKQCPLSFNEMIQSWDLSFKDTTDGSFVVGQVWGRSGADYYLVDQIRSRMDFPSTKNAIRRFTRMYPDAIKKIVEDKANGPAILSDLRREIPGMVAYSSKDSKEARLSAVSPLFESGNVFLPDKSIHEWITDFVEELVNFPNALNDDQVDACSQALVSFKRQGITMPNIVLGVGAQYDSEIF